MAQEAEKRVLVGNGRRRVRGVEIDYHIYSIPGAKPRHEVDFKAPAGMKLGWIDLSPLVTSYGSETVVGERFEKIGWIPKERTTPPMKLGISLHPPEGGERVTCRFIPQGRMRFSRNQPLQKPRK